MPASQIVGYLPNYGFGTTMALNKIDWNALTQINYFAVQPLRINTTNPTDHHYVMPAPADDATLTALDNTVAAAHQHGLKVSVVLGGANQDGVLREIINDSVRRGPFISSLQQFCTLHQVNGVDLDWEPGSNTGYPTQTEINNYSAFIHAVRVALPTPFTLSAAVAPETLPLGGDWNNREYILNDTQVVTDLDQIGIMAYDLEFNINSSLTHSESDLDAWVSHVTDLHGSASKVLFGVPFYGTYGTDWPNTTPKSYNDVIDGYLDQVGIPDTTINSTSLTVAFNDAFGGVAEPWSINSKGAIAKKTDDALTKGIGGVMIWDLGQDHFDQNGNYDNYSLLPVIKNTMNSRSTMAGSGGTFLYANRPAVKVNFATGLLTSTLGPADLVLTNTTTNQTINTATLATATYDSFTTSASWTFNSSLLPDGNYRATLSAGSLRDVTSKPLSTDYSFTFFVLAGDANHDRTVNATDLGALSANWQGSSKTFLQGDFNYDGKVDINDLYILASKYQQTLSPPPVTAVPAAISDRRAPVRTAVR